MRQVEKKVFVVATFAPVLAATENNSHRPLGAGVVSVAVIGAAVFALIVGLICYYCCKRRAQEKSRVHQSFLNASAAQHRSETMGKAYLSI